MRFLILVLLAAAGAGCGSDMVCHKEDTRGIYKISYTTESGDCGDIPDMLISLNESDETPGCLTSLEYANNNCRVEETATCNVAGVPQFTVVLVAEQQDSHGDKFEGEATVQIMGYCTGTYSFHAERR